MNYKMDTLRNTSKREELSNTSSIPSTLLARATKRLYMFRIVLVVVTGVNV